MGKRKVPEPMTERVGQPPTKRIPTPWLKRLWRYLGRTMDAILLPLGVALLVSLVYAPLQHSMAFVFFLPLTVAIVYVALTEALWDYSGWEG